MYKKEEEEEGQRKMRRRRPAPSSGHPAWRDGMTLTAVSELRNRSWVPPAVGVLGEGCGVWMSLAG